jgi:hypothetical protein
MTTLEELRANKQEILQLVEAAGATNLRVFGSVLRGDDNANSDIDFLVDWEADHSLFERIDLAHQLEDKLHKKIDLIVAKNLHWYVKDDIMKYAEPL